MNSPIPVIDKRFQIDSNYGVVVHRNFKPLYADDNYARIYGLEDAQAVLAIGSLLNLIVPDERESAIQAYEAIMAGRQNPGIHTYHNIDHEGNVFVVLTVDHVIEWQGEPAMQITVMDLSVQFDTLLQLHASEQRYRELVDGSTQGILVHREFKPLFCNRAYANMLGFENEQALLELESILPLFDVSFHEQAWKNYRTLLSDCKRKLTAEAKCHRVDGKTAWLNLLSRPITWNGEQAIQVTALDFTHQHHLREQLEYQANYDSLTDLLNRRAVAEILEAQIVTHELQGRSLCCVLIDLDDFKAINDSHGHHVGDDALRHFAATCRRNLRQTDFVGRWGGEEFILLLPGTTVEQARTLAGRLRQETANIMVATSNGEIGITVSMGIAALMHKSESAEQLLARADKALYVAKRRGKNRIELAKEETS